MIYQLDPGMTRWFIVFQNGEHVGDWVKILKDGFQHCWAFTYDQKTDTWFKVDPTHRNIVIRPLTRREATWMLMDLKDKVVVAYNAKPNKFMWKGRFFVDCASVVSYLIGVDIFFHTPWRLFCELRKRGAEVSLPEEYILEK